MAQDNAPACFTVFGLAAPHSKLITQRSLWLPTPPLNPEKHYLTLQMGRSFALPQLPDELQEECALVDEFLLFEADRALMKLLRWGPALLWYLGLQGASCDSLFWDGLP